MEIHLTPESQEIIQKKIESGRYDTPGEVVMAALILLDDRDRFHEMKLEDLRREIQKGLDSGPPVRLDMEAIKDKARRRLAKEQGHES